MPRGETARMIRIGFGYDLHRLVSGRRLVLAGVDIPFDKGLEGHSDGDVLAHAIIDALLGAAALGSIGQHFPDTNSRFKDADSLELLRTVVEMLAEAQCRVVNVDSCVVAQQPKLQPYFEAMRTRLAECLRVDPDRVSVKAKTNEEVGPEGRGEAVSAQAVALIEGSAESLG